MGDHQLASHTMDQESNSPRTAAQFRLFRMPLSGESLLPLQLSTLIVPPSTFRIPARNIATSREIINPDDYSFTGPTEEVQQSEGLQSLAQERREIHEDLPSMPGHLSLDRQDRYTQQSYRQRSRCTRMSRMRGQLQSSLRSGRVPSNDRWIRTMRTSERTSAGRGSRTAKYQSRVIGPEVPWSRHPGDASVFRVYVEYLRNIRD